MFKSYQPLHCHLWTIEHGYPWFISRWSSCDVSRLWWLFAATKSCRYGLADLGAADCYRVGLMLPCTCGYQRICIAIYIYGGFHKFWYQIVHFEFKFSLMKRSSYWGTPMTMEPPYTKHGMSIPKSTNHFASASQPQTGPATGPPQWGKNIPPQLEWQKWRGKLKFLLGTLMNCCHIRSMNQSTNEGTWVFPTFLFKMPLHRSSPVSDGNSANGWVPNSSDLSWFVMVCHHVPLKLKGKYPLSLKSFLFSHEC